MHRDIKPANILIGANGQVKVADFGIARAMNVPTESNLTQAGAVMGTATYFSPEQAQGAQPDPRSDLYSLGIVLYEMVAGRPPFTGENPSASPTSRCTTPAAAEPDRRPTSPAVRGDRRQAPRQGPEGALRARPTRCATTCAGSAPANPCSPSPQRPSRRRARRRDRTDGRRSTRCTRRRRRWRRRSPTPPPPTGSAHRLLARRRATTSRRPHGRGGTRWPPSSPSSPSASVVSCCSTPCPATTRRASNALKDYVGVPPRRTPSPTSTSLRLSHRPIPQENSTVPEDIGPQPPTPCPGRSWSTARRCTAGLQPAPRSCSRVPNVEGRMLDEAVRILSAGRLHDRRQTPEESDEIPEGIGDPHPLRRPVNWSRRATVITLVVSSGSRSGGDAGDRVRRAPADSSAVLEAEPYRFRVT